MLNRGSKLVGGKSSRRNVSCKLLTSVLIYSCLLTSRCLLVLHRCWQEQSGCSTDEADRDQDRCCTAGRQGLPHCASAHPAHSNWCRPSNTLPFPGIALIVQAYMLTRCALSGLSGAVLWKASYQQMCPWRQDSVEDVTRSFMRAAQSIGQVCLTVEE